MAKLVIQKHHLQYAREDHKQQDIVANIYKGEHMLLTRLQWRKNHSKGFCKAIRMWLLLHEDGAVEL